MVHEVKGMSSFYGDVLVHRRLMKVLTKRLGHLMLGRVEAAKIAASSHENGAISMAEIEATMRTEIDALMLEHVLTAKCNAVVETARRAVKLAGLAGGRIDTLYFTGGSAALPALRRSFSAAFPDSAPVFGDPFGSVAKGLGVRAAALFR